MPIIDAQVHAYEADRPERPWAGVLAGPAHVTGDEMVAAMDAAGVDGALLVSPWTMYRFDASYALAVHAAHPGRFGLIKPFDSTDPAVAEAVADWAATPGVVGARLMLDRGGVTADPDDPGLNGVVAAAAKHGLPVNILAWNRLAQFARLAANNPDAQLVLDHLGIRQLHDGPVPADCWADLPQVLDIARYPNVAIKVTGAGTLSHQPFPYPDIWPHLERIFAAYGLERCLWGTDWTRAVHHLTFRQGVDAFRDSDRLSASDKAMLMGGALTRIYKWSPSAG
jgi:predicted TIM-barrel fold metal-dependent hydrolase